jgi:hypothetical protein
MGIAGYDLDSDGYQEYFLTSMADNKLQTLAIVPKDGKPAEATFKDVASNVQVLRFPLRWSLGRVDYDIREDACRTAKSRAGITIIVQVTQKNSNSKVILDEFV